MKQYKSQDIINEVINNNAKLIKKYSFWFLQLETGVMITDVRKGSFESAESKMASRMAINLEVIDNGYIVSKKF
jgi:hypothetical protein